MITGGCCDPGIRAARWPVPLRPHQHLVVEMLSLGPYLLAGVMCDSPLYAVNMFYYHWLVKKLFWPMAGQNRGRQEN